MKKILGLAFAGALLIACGGSNRNATGMQNTTPAAQNAPSGNEQYGGTSATGTGMENQQPGATGTGTGMENQQPGATGTGMENQQPGTQAPAPTDNTGNTGTQTPQQ